MSGTQRSILISTQLRQIAEQAIEHPDRVFTSLIHRMDFDFLREAFFELRRDGAPGLSGVTVKDYEKDLEANLEDLHERLKERSYRAPPIKRVWIEKDNGKKRPIGLVEIEDKIVQKAVSMLMGAVYEQDFRPISYGFREGRNAHEALAYLREQCMRHGIRWIYDADITGFFDNLDWGWLRTFIQHRINDGGILRLIGKWLNAGIMEGEQISYSDKGTPQGGVISPLDGIGPDRLHIDSRQGLFHGGQRRQGVPHGQGAPHQVEIELHHAGHAAQLAPDQRFFRGAVHVLDVIDGNRHPGSGAGLCF
jgi:retron-type reverse transcriptase